MNILKYMAGAAFVAIAISSCDESTMELGGSLTDVNDNLSIKDTFFHAKSCTYVADSVLSLSNSFYFGKVKDPETGAEVKSEFTTQFHLLEHTYISPESKIIGRYDGRASADSCELLIYIESAYNENDSLTAVKMRIRELAKPMEEGVKYYSNFDPVSRGYILTNGLSKNKMFTYKDLMENDSVRDASDYQNHIRITLNQPYTKDGVTYNNYGTYLMRNYYDHPEYFKNSYSFIHNLCPGFFFEMTDGVGFHSQISNIGLRVHYRIDADTAVTNALLTLAGTKEVLQTSHITNDMDVIKKLAKEDTHTYLKSPAGLFTEVSLPVTDIMEDHQNDSLLAAKIIFQRLNNQSTDSRQLGIPQTIVMIQKDSLISYFENNNVPDGKTSYYTTFASSTNTYTFTNISNLITYLWQVRADGVAKDATWEAKHPNWNKVLLIPVKVKTSSSTSTLTRVEHDMSLSSIRLVGGDKNPNDPITINVVYGKFK